MIYSSSRFRCNQNQSSTTFLSRDGILSLHGSFRVFRVPSESTFGNFVQIWSQKLRLGYVFHVQVLSRNLFFSMGKSYEIWEKIYYKGFSSGTCPDRSLVSPKKTLTANSVGKPLFLEIFYRGRETPLAII